MADTEEPQFNTLAERIAALNMQNADTPRKRAPPPPPPGPPARTQTGPAVVPTNLNGSTPSSIPPPAPRPPPPLPRRDTQKVPPEQDIGRPALPPLPARTATAQPSPLLPPRRTSTQPVNARSVRRNSASSEVSARSSVSSLSLGKTPSSTTSYGSGGAGQRKLPPICDLASLPPLPPTRREHEAKTREVAAAREASWQETESPASMKPKLPPRLPSRPASTQGATSAPPTTRPAASPLKANRILGFSQRPPTTVHRTPTKPEVELVDGDDDGDDTPPPIPVASRPSAAHVQSVFAPETPAQTDCWACRDWSGPDGVAAQFPRESVPRNDPIGYLARGLCGPFPSYTDKARAIFTWFHHNVSYDTQAFFSGNIGPQTPERTISGGRAVCAGYAETYKAIAVRAGLECAVVCGHGKGFGHSALKEGERPPPPKPDGHAWNAVRIDGGDWKLIDACWGAGHIDTATNSYKREFHTTEFTAPNDKFGRKHFPSDSRYQLRSDGRVISWEEYYVGPTAGQPVEVYGNVRHEGIDEESIQPRERHISVRQGESVRFQFAKVCEHWTSEKHGLGKTPLLLLHMPGATTGLMPMETDGYRHWLDVRGEDLGGPGQAVFVALLTSFDGKEGQEARGVARREFLSKRGRVGMGWSYLMKWELR